MGMSNCAPRTTQQTFAGTGAAGALSVAAGASVTVYGLSLYAGTTKAIFTITDGSDNTKVVIGVLADTTHDCHIEWKADAGIKVQIGSVNGSPSACVFHGNPGN